MKDGSKDTYLKFFPVVLSLVLIITLSVILNYYQPEMENEETNTELANPSAVYCLELGYRYEVRNSENGQYGVCIFPDQSECSAWSYFCGCTNDKRYCGTQYPKCDYLCG